MRLLYFDSHGGVTLVGPFSRRETPRYAILSHTWGSDADEVTLVDLQSGLAESKPGYEKIAFCLKQAAADRLAHVWIDTCCIDKTSSAELSEAINSMYRWYRESARCYVFLQDVSTTSADDGIAMLRTCRWMTRGWTLQEMLAPLSVEFFSREGTLLGTKDTLAKLISEITTIPTEALSSLTMNNISRHERMRWMQHRTTKLEEDMLLTLSS
ncbi:heterokaryon incompatibility [Microdochium bolleyi]|uniref:Heterokaryon incompatibility n=1 Tax=Microdochium bolleyi TaxID=196109 RepID=A0A136J8R0_9PEZI|nr:heterokaryon incompatibility [Microdochium bolleyi]